MINETIKALKQRHQLFQGDSAVRYLIIAVTFLAMISITIELSFSQDWYITTVNTPEDVAWHTSIDLDSQNLPHISYYDYPYNDLNYVYWKSGYWHFRTVDSSADLASYNCITLDSQDHPHISYFDYTNGDLKYDHWTGDEWNIQIVDSEGDVGRFSCIALDSSSYPHISYFDNDNDDLKYAQWDGSSWQITTVDSTGDVGRDTSIALDSFDYPHISYWDVSNFYLKYAYQDSSGWHLEYVDTNGDTGRESSIALDSNNYPHISYKESSSIDLKYARWDGSNWQKMVVDSEGYVGYDTSIELDSNDYPHIAYFSNTYSNLKYAYWDGTNWSKIFVDTGGYVGEYPSLALDDSGYPHISYFDVTNLRLKYAWYGYSLDIILTSFSAQPEASAIVLTWTIQTTESEHIEGFNLYRQELSTEISPLSENMFPRLLEDDWRKINSDLITGENPYSYTDSDVEAGVAYEYKLEAVLDNESAETMGTTQATAGKPKSFSILNLYPNPASDYLTCLLALPEVGRVKIALYDLSGRLVIEKPIEVTEPSEIEVLLDVSGLASGVYTIKASLGGVEVSERAVIVR